MAAKLVTNDKIYELISRVEAKQDSIRLELKGDITAAVASVSQNQGRLEAKFDALESGRLTEAERRINDLQVTLQRFEGKIDTNEGKITTRVAILWSLAGGIFIVGSEILLNLVARMK